jgi:hypothetical protein
MKTNTTNKAPPVYFELRRRVMPIVKHFHADLIKHDRRAIRNNPETPFIHAAGENGTCLLMLSPASAYPAPGETVKYLFHRANREHILNEYTGMIECYTRNGRPVMHYHDGRGNVRLITAERAAAIVKEYQTKIRHEWNKERRT